MAISDSGQTPQRGGTEWGSTATSDTTRDRRPAGGGGIAQLVRDATYQRLDSQKTQASSTLRSLAGAVRGMSQQLQDGGQAGVAHYTTRAADGMERWASQLGQQDIGDAIRGVQRFARRDPALFLGIAFSAGVLAARFLKSSSRDSDTESDWYGGRRQDPMVSGSYGAAAPSAPVSPGSAGAISTTSAGATTHAAPSTSASGTTSRARTTGSTGAGRLGTGGREVV